MQGIKDIRLGKGKDGACKGFAYVEMEDMASLQAAVEKNDLLFEGKHLFIAESKPPASKGDRSGKFSAGRGPGSGGPRGRGRAGRGAGRLPTRDHRHKAVILESSDAPATTSAPVMLPRAVIKAAPKSNAEFRKFIP